MNPTTTQSPIGITFVVRFWCEWSQGQPRWRGRVEHVESGQQANFLVIEDLLGFFRRFGIGAAIPAAGRRDDDPCREEACQGSKREK